MNISSPTTPKPREPLSILLLGPPGSRKTTLTMQFPKPYFIDCDGNLDGPEKFLRANGHKELTYGYDSANTENGKEVPVHDRYDRTLSLASNCKDLDVSTVILDGLTLVDQFLVQKILKTQSQSELKPKDYATIKSAYWNLLVRLRASGKDHIVLCHEVPNYETDPKNMMKEIITGYEASISGKFRHFLGAFFKDIWRCQVEQEATPKGMVTVSKLYTCKTVKSPDLKNSLGMPAVMAASYTEIKKYL